MPRTAADVGTPRDSRWPPAGKVIVTCVEASRWKSPKKGTLAIMLIFENGEYRFDDPVFITTKAIRRLNLVAMRLCDMPDDIPLPDDDAEAAREIATYVLNHACGKRAKLTIDVSTEEFIYEQGEKTGQKGTRERHRVAFAGYERANGEEAEESKPIDPDDIPF